MRVPLHSHIAPFFIKKRRQYDMVDSKKQPKRPRKQVKKAHKQKKIVKNEALQPENQPERMPVSSEEEATPSPQLETTMIDSGEDRMLRYKRNPRCPICDAHPVICTIRRISYKAFCCRMCGHRWEVSY